MALIPQFKTSKPPLNRLSSGGVMYLIDAMVWMTAIYLAALLRYEFEISQIHLEMCVAFSLAAALLQLLIGSVFHLYRGSRKIPGGTFEEARYVAVVVGAVGGILFITSVIFGGEWQISRGKMLIAAPLALMMMLAVRYLLRALTERSRRPSSASTRALVLGGGYVGMNLIQWMMLDPSSAYRPVGVLDDDPKLTRSRIRGIPVLGTLDDIEKVAELTGVGVLIVAINSPKPQLLRRVQDQATKLGLSVKLMPPIGDVVTRGVGGNDLRDLSIEDLLGRQPVETDVAEIAEYLMGKRVLVTGAGGSIGAQLCVEIAKYEPAELIMLDRDETGLQGVLINIAGNGLLDTDAVVLADIRDSEEIRKIFLHRRPEVVFHAAALKHLPMLEQYPDEAWKTNVLGTLNTLQAAEAAGVETFVNISTDKAANPTSVLGHSKRMAEMLTAWFGNRTGKNYLSVRFGNVIGSRGSMLPTFMRLIDEDKPLTVTHPDVTRYFMTIPEACQLVLQAGGIGRAGEVLILDMGEPVSILKIAQRMVDLSGKDIEIVYTGLREGEKLHEELVGDGETEERPFHPKISHARADSLSPLDLTQADFLAALGKKSLTEGVVNP